MATSIIPPAPKVHAKPLPAWRVLIDIGRNSLGIWSEQSFEALLLRNHAFGVDSILVNDPEAVRHVLGAPPGRYGRPISVYRITRPLAGDGVLLAEGDDWRRQRKLLAPLFAPSSLGGIVPHFVAAGEALVARLEGRRRANLSKAFQDAALDAVLRALFSTPFTAEAAGFTTLARSYLAGPGRPGPLDGFARTEDAFAFAAAGRRRFAKARIREVGALVAARRAAATLGDRRDLASLLMAARDPETGEGLTDAEIADQAATFVFAGFETTARLLFWTAYLLTLDRSEQGRIREEVRVFPPERVQSLDDLQHWPRLRRTLLEALRLYPPAPNIVRTALEDDELGGEPVKPGTQVWISPWVLHRHRRFWESPTSFQPDRFADQSSPWTSVGAFVPFGGGPRICIGASFAMAEAQIVLASLIARYDISLTTALPVVPIATITIAPSIEPEFDLTPVPAKPSALAA